MTEQRIVKNTFIIITLLALSIVSPVFASTNSDLEIIGNQITPNSSWVCIEYDWVSGHYEYETRYMWVYDPYLGDYQVELIYAIWIPGYYECVSWGQ